jgi:hypothetical protein
MITLRTSPAAASSLSISTQAPSEPRKLPGQWAAEGDSYDCTVFIGPLFPHLNGETPEWPMYSYDRPGSIVWNTIAANLNKRGWSDEKIKFWLQSKHPRWALDGHLGDLLEKVADAYATAMISDDQSAA